MFTITLFHEWHPLQLKYNMSNVGRKRGFKGISFSQLIFSLLPVWFAAPLVSKKRNIDTALGGKTFGFI